ncbi:MAG: hypothetical protein L6Q78_04400 [Bacteroidia bacterium]|nr:hypothetical protein [Bacteroidia bacterium]
MKITIKAEAAATINKLVKFIDSKNTPGSGKRFALKFLNKIVDFQKNMKHIPYASFQNLQKRDGNVF